MALIKSVIKDLQGCLFTLHKRRLLMEIAYPITEDTPPVITYSKNPKMLDNISNYVPFFLTLIENKNYICLLPDGSILQCYYKFSNDGDSLVEGSLSYLPNPGLSISPEFREKKLINYDEEERYLSEFTSKYIRIDFNHKGYRELLHPCCHLHLGIESNYRIALNKFPFFSEFVKFILFLNYEDKWMKTIPTIKKGHDIGIDIRNYIKLRVRTEKEKFIPSTMTDSEKKHYHLII